LQRIILDTDPGIDDALALFLALASPEIQLEAITTVSGNVDVEFTTQNALTLLTLAGRTNIPVARGCKYPLVRQTVDAAQVHGLNGLGDVELPAPACQAVKLHAVDLIIEKVMNAPGEITLVAIGPLTNIALAARHEPRIIQNVREVVIMGGALRVPGNVTPSSEFNIHADPHAAHIVLSAGWPLRLVSLDVTERTVLQRVQFTELAAQGGQVPQFIERMIAFYFDQFLVQHKGETGFAMHDPLCLAAAFQSDLITWEPAYVAVELNGALTLGETVAYFHKPEAPDANIQASVDVDAERFTQLFLERIKSFYR
jgi:inosine-uridine nucleoside N-ribohydrolase